jgi:hypothetical protein
MKQFISIFTICYLLSLTLSAQLNSYPVTVDVKDKSVLSIHGSGLLMNSLKTR